MKVKFIKLGLLATLFVAVYFFNLNFHSLLAQPSLFLHFLEPPAGNVKVYWDTGQGFNENETWGSSLHPGYTSQFFKLPIHKEAIAMRIDPVDHADPVRLSQINLSFFKNFGGTAITRESILSTHHIDPLSIESTNTRTFELKITGNDPYLIIPDIQTYLQSLNTQKNLLIWIMGIFSGFISIGAAIIVWR